MLGRFHLAIASLTVITAAVFLLALMVLLADERRETVGTLRLIGLTRGRVLAQVLLEGAIIAGAGAAFGVALAALTQSAFNAFFQWRYDTSLVFVRITPSIAWRSVAVAMPLGMAASVLASWALVRSNDAEAGAAMRALAFAWRSLLRRRGRSALGILGIAAAGALMFDMLLLSRGLLVSVRELLDAFGFDVRVFASEGMPQPRLPVDRAFDTARVAGRAAGGGVRGAVPVRRGRDRRGVRAARRGGDLRGRLD